MTPKRRQGKRNLLFLNWMGLICQLVGVIYAVGALAFFPDQAWGGILFLVFGVALAGWAGNLQRIVELEYRVADLEGASGN